MKENSTSLLQLSSEPTIIVSGCKLNFFLHIKDKRPDGYHNLETLFVPLDYPADTLSIVCKEPDDTNGRLVFSCTDQGVNPANNTLTKAYTLYASATGFSPSLAVHLDKKVPHGAGLGGGSANAAALFSYLQKRATLYGFLPLSSEELFCLAAKVGADVPFFLLNTPAIATGIGDKLTPIDLSFYSDKTLLLLCPKIAISTAWAFAELDRLRIKNEKKIKNKNIRLTSEAILAIYSFAHTVKFINDFEEVVYAKYPEVFALRNLLLEHGADHALLSGTGSTVFGVFSKKATAEKILKRIDLTRCFGYITQVRCRGVAK